MRTTRPRYTYRIIERTTHYRIVAGHVRRDCIAERSDGQLRLISIMEAAA